VYSSGIGGAKRVGNVSTVDSPNQAFMNMADHWSLLETLLGGTYALRKGHRKFLPQYPREDDLSYDNRLKISCLSPFYARIEKMLAGMLTRKPVRLTDVSDTITEQLFDADLQGNDITQFLYEATRICLRYGHVGVLVDAAADGSGRPYFVRYTPRDILGWRSEIIDGTQKLTQLRLFETTVEPEGEYGEKVIEQVRVLTPGAYEIHRKDKDGEFKLFDEGTTTVSEIPFSVAYSNRVGLLESRPPMNDIAELNLKHYQASSDLSNQLRISAVPFLAIYGMPPSAEEITAGPSEAMSLPADSRVEFVEPSGNSYEAQFKHLDRIAEEINTLALASVLGQKLSAETAESKRIDRSQGDSTMMLIAQQMQDLLDNCLRFHAEYLNDSQPGTAYVNRDFLGQRLEPQEIQALLQLYTAGTITQETLLTQLSAGEVLGDEFDVDEEMEATQAGNLIETQQPEPTPPVEEEATMPEEEQKQEDEDELDG
jgi:hypothetical protein